MYEVGKYTGTNFDILNIEIKKISLTFADKYKGSLEHCYTKKENDKIFFILRISNTTSTRH